MDAAGKHVCSLCMHYHAYTCMFTFVPSKPYVNTRFHFCPTAGKVNQVDRKKIQPGAETAFLCIKDLSLPFQDGECWITWALPSIKTAFVLYFGICDCKARG